MFIKPGLFGIVSMPATKPFQGILLPDGSTIGFEVDPFAKLMLLAGTDELGYLLGKKPEIGAWEAANAARVDTRLSAAG